MFNRHTKLTHRVMVKGADGATPVAVTLWNPTSETIADFMECDVEDVDWYEDDDGEEWCKARGEIVGKVESF